MKSWISFIALLVVGTMGLQLGRNANLQAAETPSPVAISAHYTVPTAGKPGVLSITATIQEGWHIYSITQAKGGPVPSKIAVPENPSYSLSGDFTASPKPEIHTDDVFPGINLEEHRNQVTWQAPIRLADGANPANVTIAGKVTVQACSDIDKNCLPPKPYEFSAANKSTAGEYRHAQSHAVIRGHIEPATVAPGGKAKLVLTAEPFDDYYVYAQANAVPATGSKPTIIALAPSSALLPGKVVASQAPKAKPVATGGEQLIHKEPVSWTVELTVPQSTVAGDYPVSGLIGFQTCYDKGCDTPKGAKFEAVLTVGKSATPPTASLPVNFTPATYAEAAIALAAADTKVAPDFAQLPAMIGFGLLGGLILNLMPCVLPVIGLKILSFVQQSGQSRAKVFTLNLWYTLGLLSVFAVLATLASGVQLGLTNNDLGWGQQFQSTGFNIVMCGIVFAMALSFLGVWEIPLPGFVGTGAATELAAKEGPAGAFFKGVLTTVLATPCSGPFLGPVFGYTLKQPPIVVYAIFLSIGLGMASPYLLIGAFPRLIKFLPKPGAWMDTFKQMMAFVLLATVVFMFTFLKRDYLVPTFGMLIAIWAGCWWIGRTPLYEGAKKVGFAWGQGLVTAFIAGWISFTLLGPTTKVLPWQPFSPSRLAELTSSGKTVMIDFTADWCLTCKANLKYAIDILPVKEIVDRQGIVPLLADWTDESPEIKQTLEKLDSNSIPVLAIFPANKPNEPIILRDLVTKQQVLDALNAAGPSNDQKTAYSLKQFPWQEFSADRLNHLVVSGKTVMVDFTANWDLSTIYPNRQLDRSPEIKEAVNRLGVVTLLADWTDESPEIKAVLEKLGSNSIPLLAIYPAGKPNDPIILRDLRTAEQVLDALNAAGPSRQFETTALSLSSSLP